MTVWVGWARAPLLVCALASGGNLAAAPDGCRLALTSRYVGARAVPAVRSAIRAITRSRPLRWIAPGQVITMDYNARRLNVILDERGRIMAMRCG